jgi:hypothetical protein
MIRVRSPDLWISFPSSFFFPAVICVNSSVALSFVVLCLPPSLPPAFPAASLSFAFAAPSHYDPRTVAFQSSLSRRPEFLWPFFSSFRFAHSSFPDRPWLAPHASRGERGKKSAGYEGPGKTATRFTADGTLRTEPRTGPWTVGGRGVDWVRERGMNRSWGSKFPEL